MCVCVCVCVCVFCGAATQRGSWPPHSWGFLDHTQRRTTVGRTSLDEWSARRRDLYLTTHNTHTRQTSMPPVGFDPMISAGERPQTYVLDRAANFISASHFKSNHHDLWGSFIHRAFVLTPLSVNLPVEVGVYVSGVMNITSASITEWTVLRRIFGHESASCSDKYADSQPSLTKQLCDAAVP